MKKIIMISGVAAAITYSVTSHSFGFDDLVEKTTGAATASAIASDLLDDEGSIGVLPAFIVASGNVNKAQIMLAKAFNLKEQAALLEAESSAFEKGATIESDQIETIMVKQTETSKLIDEKIASGYKLSAEGHILYAKSLAPYSLGLYGLNKLVDEVKDVKTSSVSFSEGLQLAVLTKGMPDYTDTLFTTTRSVLTYAKSIDIEIPDEAAKNFDFL